MSDFTNYRDFVIKFENKFEIKFEIKFEMLILFYVESNHQLS
jgi:hypothetical protein